MNSMGGMTGNGINEMKGRNHMNGRNDISGMGG